MKIRNRPIKSHILVRMCSVTYWDKILNPVSAVRPFASSCPGVGVRVLSANSCSLSELTLKNNPPHAIKGIRLKLLHIEKLVPGLKNSKGLTHQKGNGHSGIAKMTGKFWRRSLWGKGLNSLPSFLSFSLASRNSFSTLQCTHLLGAVAALPFSHLCPGWTISGRASIVL